MLNQVMVKGFKLPLRPLFSPWLLVLFKATPGPVIKVYF